MSAIGYSVAKDINQAVTEIAGQLVSVSPKMVVYFASSEYQPHELAEKMGKAFAGAQVIGCSTSGEIISGKMLKGSIVAMAFGAEIIEDVVVEAVTNISTADNLTDALLSFEKHYQTAMLKINPTEYVGLVFFDGLSRAEEKLMDKLGNCTDVAFIGGSAGDDLKFAATYVYANGKAHTDAAVLALIKTGCNFDVIKTQSFSCTGKKMVATKVDEATRTVFEFDGKSAATAYAENISQPVDKLADYFMTRPLGLMIDQEPFVRSPQQVKGGSVVFYCNVKEGMELEVLEATDVVEETAKAVKKKEKEMGQLVALLNFHCILRTLQLEGQGLTAKYGLIFDKIPTIGFSTYGEAYIGHINQTSTMLAFAK